MMLLLRELADIKAGFQPKEGLKTGPVGTHYAVQAKDIDDDNDHILLSHRLEKINANRDLTAYAVHKGDVLFLARGRKRYATLIEDLPADCPVIALYYFFIVRVRTHLIDPGFLAWFINEDLAQRYLEKTATQTGMPFVAKQSFSTMEIKTPPLEIQTEIVQLHRLAQRESRLLRRLEAARLELARSTCWNLYETVV